MYDPTITPTRYSQKTERPITHIQPTKKKHNRKIHQSTRKHIMMNDRAQMNGHFKHSKSTDIGNKWTSTFFYQPTSFNYSFSADQSTLESFSFYEHEPFQCQRKNFASRSKMIYNAFLLELYLFFEHTFF